MTGAFSLAAACSSHLASTPMARLTKEPFGQTPDGQAIDIVTLRNLKSMEVRIMTYGGIIVSLRVPDRAGQVDDVVLGHDDAAGYFNNSPFLGALIGRYGNRIAKGKFTLDGHDYTLATNNAPNHLHGGTKGWNQAVWEAEPFQDVRGVGVVMSHTSPDGDEGYPGTVKASVTYTLTDNNELKVEYSATTDKPTIINLTQHSYFNLGGTKTPDILTHQLQINADRYTPVDETLIPTGELALVAGTPFDFRQATAIGARIEQADEQLTRGKGYDHNWVLNRSGDGMSPAASAFEPQSGRTLDISTTEPGIQFYSGNFLDGTLMGKGGRPLAHRSGFCLETQHYPDSPNHPTFPSTVVRPGTPYHTTTVFKFGAR